MSFIATSQSLPIEAVSARSHVSAAGFLNDPALSHASHTVVSTGLQATLGLAIMAGLSLVLCTIAAGAIL